MPKQPKSTALFYEDEAGDPQDRNIHNAIVNGGDHAKAEAVSREVMKKIGLSDAQIDACLPYRLPFNEALMQGIRKKYRKAKA